MTQAMPRCAGMSAAKQRRQAIIACTAPGMEQTIIRVLREFRIEPVLSESLEEIQALLAENETLIAFTQAKFGGGRFQDVLNAAHASGAGVPIVVCSESYSKDLYIYVMSLGAFDYLAFPYSCEEVKWVIRSALNGGSTPLKILRHDAA